MEREVRREPGVQKGVERTERVAEIGGRGRRRKTALGGGAKRAPPRSPSAAEGSTARTLPQN